MGKSLFIVLAVCIMYSGVRGGSESMSCSTVNGKTICNKQSSQGNTAMASSSAGFDPQGSSQETYAGAGNPGQWEYGRQRVTTGNGGPTPSNDYFDFDKADFRGDPGRFDGPVGGGCSYSSSGSAKNFGTDAGPTPVVGGYGFASAGNVFRPEFPKFSPEIANTPQDSSVPNGSGPPVRNNFGNDNSGFQVSSGGFGGPPVGGSSYSYSSSDPAPNFGTNERPMTTIGGFAGGPSVGGMSYSSSSSGLSPNFGTNVGTVSTVGGFAGGPSVGGMSYSSSSSGPGPNFGTNMGTVSTVGGFGGPSVGGMSYSYSSSGPAPNFGTNEGPMPTAGGFGFASAGNTFTPGFPFNFVSGFVNGQQGPSRTNGGGFPAGGFAGGFPGGGYAGGFPGGGYAGGFAGAGAGYMPPGFPDPFRMFGRR